MAGKIPIFHPPWPTRSRYFTPHPDISPPTNPDISPPVDPAGALEPQGIAGALNIKINKNKKRICLVKVIRDDDPDISPPTNPDISPPVKNLPPYDPSRKGS
jgi:hypothetical protein